MMHSICTVGPKFRCDLRGKKQKHDRKLVAPRHEAHNWGMGVLQGGGAVGW